MEPLPFKDYGSNKKEGITNPPNPETEASDKENTAAEEVKTEAIDIKTE